MYQVILEYLFCFHLVQSQLIVYNSSLSAGTPNTGTSAVTRRLTQDSLKHEKIKKCTVIMPKLDLGEVKVWCLYHLQHDCPCHQLKNPLDYGPDINKSRNVAKRTLGNNFKTKKLEKTPRNRYEKSRLFSATQILREINSVFFLFLGINSQMCPKPLKTLRLPCARNFTIIPIGTVPVPTGTMYEKLATRAPDILTEL